MKSPRFHAASMRAMRARIAAFSAASSTATGAAGAGASARAGTARPARSKAQSFGAKGVILGLLPAARHGREHVVPQARSRADGFIEFQTHTSRRISGTDQLRTRKHGE